MRIGLLETGEPPGDLLDIYGSYSSMFEALLGPGPAACTTASDTQ